MLLHSKEAYTATFASLTGCQARWWWGGTLHTRQMTANEIVCSSSSHSNFDFKKLMEQRINALLCLVLSDHVDEFVHFLESNRQIIELIYKTCKYDKIRKLRNNYPSKKEQVGLLIGCRGTQIFFKPKY